MPRWIFWGSIAVCLAIITGGVALAATKKAQATSIAITYPQPPGTQESAVFSVTVNDQPVFVEKYNDINYAHFSLVGKVDIKVTVKENIQKYTLSPKSYNIASTSSGKEISFSLNRPRKLILHKVNSLNEKLFIFADPLEDDPPQLDDPGVVNIMDYGVDNTGKQNENRKIQQAIDAVAAQSGGGVLYFPPGSYKTGDLYMKSKVTMYLAGGARLYWNDRTFIRFEQLKNASLVGRGVIDGHGIRINESNNVALQGIILRPHKDDYWSVEMKRSNYVTVYNTKVIADFGLGRDGFDLNLASHVLIDNVFAYTGDDFVAVKAETQGPDIEDINVRNSVFFTGASGCKVGTGTHNDFIRDITFENVDCVSHSYVALRLVSGDGATVEEIYFKNIRVEQFLSREGAIEATIDFRVYTRVWPADRIGHIRDVYVMNLAADITMPSYIIGFNEEHLLENVTLDNYYIEGRSVRNKEEGDIVTDRKGAEYVKNLIFARSNPAIVGITATDLYASESGADPGVFIIKRTGNTSEKVTVNCTIRGTAENGKDYQSIPTTVTIPAGAASTTIAIIPTDDDLNEGLETVFISLDNLPHTTDSYMLGPDFHAVVNIIDDNDPPAGPVSLRILQQ
jgi:hypothetical protein